MAPKKRSHFDFNKVVEEFTPAQTISGVDKASLSYTATSYCESLSRSCPTDEIFRAALLAAAYGHDKLDPSPEDITKKELEIINKEINDLADLLRGKVYTKLCNSLTQAGSTQGEIQDAILMIIKLVFNATFPTKEEVKEAEEKAKWKETKIERLEPEIAAKIIKKAKEEPYHDPSLTDAEFLMMQELRIIGGFQQPPHDFSYSYTARQFIIFLIKAKNLGFHDPELPEEIDCQKIMAEFDASILDLTEADSDKKLRLRKFRDLISVILFSQLDTNKNEPLVADILEGYADDMREFLESYPRDPLFVADHIIDLLHALPEKLHSRLINHLGDLFLTVSANPEKLAELYCQVNYATSSNVIRSARVLSSAISLALFLQALPIAHVEAAITHCVSIEKINEIIGGNVGTFLDFLFKLGNKKLKKIAPLLLTNFLTHRRDKKENPLATLIEHCTIKNRPHWSMILALCSKPILEANLRKHAQVLKLIEMIKTASDFEQNIHSTAKEKENRLVSEYQRYIIYSLPNQHPTFFLPADSEEFSSFANGLNTRARLLWLARCPLLTAEQLKARFSDQEIEKRLDPEVMTSLSHAELRAIFIINPIAISLFSFKNCAGKEQTLKALDGSLVDQGALLIWQQFCNALLEYSMEIISSRLKTLISFILALPHDCPTRLVAKPNFQTLRRVNISPMAKQAYEIICALQNRDEDKLLAQVAEVDKMNTVTASQESTHCAAHTSNTAKTASC